MFTTPASAAGTRSQRNLVLLSEDQQDESFAESRRAVEEWASTHKLNAFTSQRKLNAISRDADMTEAGVDSETERRLNAFRSQKAQSRLSDKRNIFASVSHLSNTQSVSVTVTSDPAGASSPVGGSASVRDRSMLGLASSHHPSRSLLAAPGASVGSGGHMMADRFLLGSGLDTVKSMDERSHHGDDAHAHSHKGADTDAGSANKVASADALDVQSAAPELSQQSHRSHRSHLSHQSALNKSETADDRNVPLFGKVMARQATGLLMRQATLHQPVDAAGETDDGDRRHSIASAASARSSVEDGQLVGQAHGFFKEAGAGAGSGSAFGTPQTTDLTFEITPTIEVTP
mgnify:CR=1 FL=1